MVQNMRNTWPGLKKRKGQTKLHTTADGTNRGMSLYQYSKGKKSENHLYAQMSDSDVLEATNAPPTVTAGVFGPEVFSGAASPWPASWANLDDLLLFGNGVDQHQIFTGTARVVDKFIVFKGTAAPPAVPTVGEDYSDEVRGVKSGNAILDSLGDLAVDFDCLFVGCPVPFDTLTWTIPYPNGTAAVMAANYRKNDSTWAAVSGLADNTASGGATLAVTGATMTWTMPTDWIPSYMYGKVRYWVQLYLSSGDLDAEVEVSDLTFESDWKAITNMWDGVPVEAIEAQFYDVSATNYYTYGGTSIDISSMTSTDILYVSSYDMPDMMYIDVGDSPSTTGSVTLSMLYYDGVAWQAMTIVDGSSGFQQSGWVTFARPTLSKQQNFNKTQYYAHWFKLTVDVALSDKTSVGIYFAPYFDINEIGKGLANCAWKGRMVYSTNFDHYIYVTAQGNPQVLNGSDYGMLEPGDGRPNFVVAMRRFKNELMVWQQEKGTDGGCLTLFEGYTPETFGKLVLSSKLGTMNNNSVDIVEGVLTSTKTDEVVKDMVYCLSRCGVYVTDGVYCSMISDDIQNYFDPTDTTNCIRYSYEKLMWLRYDSAENVIKIGLVCGSSATVPNVFPVYDLNTRTWSFDSPGQALACMVEVEAGSGNVPVLQIGGGTADGFIYLLNNSDDDVGNAIDSYITAEFNDNGNKFNLDELILRCKVQSAGDITLTPYNNGIAQSTKTLSMTAEVATQTTRRHRTKLNQVGHHVSLKFQNAVAAQMMNLYDYQVGVDLYEGQ